jgi:Tfp pilus assembly major pilin PilA
MSAFISACIVAAVIAVVAAMALNTVQKPVESAFATSAVRI